MSYNKICFKIPQTCDICFEYSIAPCLSIINIQTTNLINSTTYYLYVRDKFNNIYLDPVVGKIDGSFDIATTNFPIGLFEAVSGDVTMFLSTSTTDPGMHVQPLEIEGVDFTCIIAGERLIGLINRQFDDSFDESFL